MTVRELITILQTVDDLDRQVVVGNVLQSPFAVLSIKEVMEGEEGPVYIRAERKDRV